MKKEWIGVFLQFFTTWNIIFGILALIFKFPPTLKVSIASNMLACSIMGTILMTKYGKEIGLYYSKSSNEIQIIDIFIHYIIPLFILTFLLKRLPRYNLLMSMGYILTIIIIYGMLIDPYEQYANISELSYFIIGFPIVALLANVVIFSTRKCVL